MILGENKEYMCVPIVSFQFVTLFLLFKQKVAVRILNGQNKAA